MNDTDRAELPVSPTRRVWTTGRARELRREATPSEALLWTHLRGRTLDGARFRRQQPIGPFVVDFFCAEVGLVIEVDGGVHEQQREYDEARQAQLEGAGYTVMRIVATDVLGDIAGVLALIRAELQRSKANVMRAQPQTRDI
ncbi:MAG: endonuclease domain-containing protein [Chloroflexi bacterium]|nr:endonuclease domain-containing protein [Chloroflexota bacterium]